MSNLTPGRGRPMLPAPPPGHPIATYRTYLEAQRAVDYLSDEKFAVQHVSIVGTDLKMVERVTGRLTYGRVALAGALSGAYFGGFVGLVLGLFSSTGLGGVLLPAILIGAGMGMIFALISYAATGGRRDFTSTSQIVAAQYAVWCADDHAAEATRVLQGLDAAKGVAGPSPQPVPPAAPPAHRSQDAAQEPAQPPAPPTGPTYSEMLARQKAEQRAREDQAERAEQAAHDARHRQDPPPPQ